MTQRETDRLLSLLERTAKALEQLVELKNQERLDQRQCIELGCRQRVMHGRSYCDEHLEIPR